MPLLALGLDLAGITLAFGARTVVQRRRTGDSGLRIVAGAVGVGLEERARGSTRRGRSPSGGIVRWRPDPR
jgi:hypothetical protein